MDAFTILELPRCYALDLKSLEAAYFLKQRRYHPDQWVGKSAELRANAARQSADVNQAYETLKHPLKRAKHILQLHDIMVLDEANSSKPDMVTLQEIMELQEQRENAESIEQQLQWKMRVQTLQQQCILQLEQAFQQSDLDAAKNSTIRLSYLYKLA